MLWVLYKSELTYVRNVVCGFVEMCLKEVFTLQVYTFLLNVENLILKFTRTSFNFKNVSITQ